MRNSWSTYELVETFQLAHAVSALHETGILASLERPRTVQELSQQYRTDATVLEGVLNYVAARTNLLRKVGTTFVVTRQYSSAARFLLDLYIGAYGRNAAQLLGILRRSSMAAALVDHTKYANAFQQVGDSVLGALVQIILQLKLTHVLDLGCGPTSLLIALAKQDRHLIGWRVEMNPAMHRLTRTKIQETQLSKRIQIFLGDCRQLQSVVPPRAKQHVDVVVASQVANEMFAGGQATAITWLRQIRRALPGRLLLIADYYGRLGRTNATRYRETLLHDYVQLISGQGIPPSNVSLWKQVYSRSKCRLLHLIEDKTTSRFIHVLKL